MFECAGKTSIVADQLIQAQKGGRALSPATLEHYESELAALLTHREHMQTLIEQWWMLLGGDDHQ